jgi:hypothetical protein
MNQEGHETLHMVLQRRTHTRVPRCRDRFSISSCLMHRDRGTTGNLERHGGHQDRQKGGMARRKRDGGDEPRRRMGVYLLHGSRA